MMMRWPSGVKDARSVTGFAQEPLHRRGVAPETRAQYLERSWAVFGVLGAIHFRRAPLTHALEEAIAGDRPTGEILTGHGIGRN